MLILTLRKSRKLLLFSTRVLLISFIYQFIFPCISFALTTGPSQPEVQAFEPVGTTDMVEMATGDFSYNIPLMDVEGYPVNISYHGGVGMEQEASWVGLGWNINPGVINRTVRGIPDDFNGDVLQKEFSMKTERNIRVGMGGGVELAGVGDPLLNLSASAGASLNFSNYRGVSCDFDFGCGVNLFNCVAAGVNIGVGSQTGADLDLNAGMSFSSSQIASKEMAGGIGVNVGTGYNTRSGLKDIGISVGTTMSLHGASFRGASFSTSIPIGVKNFVPVITNSSSLKSFYGRIKVGGEVFYVYPWGNINGMVSKLDHSDADASRAAYGYLYAQNGTSSDIQDFTRDKDGLFNKKMEYLPMGNMTYDIYSANGQGTGGNFRPYRNDFGSVYDPVIESKSENFSLELEAGLGNIFEFGADGKMSMTRIKGGPWSSYDRGVHEGFQSRQKGSLYENAYFKQGGELTALNKEYTDLIKGTKALTPEQARLLPMAKPGTGREVRSNVFYYLDAREASIPEASTSRYLKSYTSTNGFAGGPHPSIDSFDRYSSNVIGRKEHQLSEITQLQSNGTRYVYGIPAMNNIQKEATFSIDSPNSTDAARSQVSYTPGTTDSKSNNKGVDHYYSATTTPAFAHSYLLTSVLSTDYSDVTGNGPSDDDLGTYTKFNYTRKEADYRWKTPYDSNRAQYNQGFISDKQDDKASYIMGSREQWYLHSIETKNFIAEFYTSARNDGKGVKDAISITGTYNVSPYNSAQSTAAKSYKLDSIKLFNKHDRFIHTTAAVAIKTVMFEYKDTLCRGIPNVVSSTGMNGGVAGKLTLDKIFVKYGNSEKSMLSPYVFGYSSFNPDYDLSAKDRWGNYKPNTNTNLNNADFPYVNQLDTSQNKYASAWSLHKITLPSGGQIKVEYEQDDYAFVQNKKATEMFKVEGFGKDENYSGGNQLYKNKSTPYLFAYFKRDVSREISGLSFKENYTKDLDYLYFNCNVLLTKQSYEQIRGYANIVGAGVCSNNSAYGYIKLDYSTPKGTTAKVNPVTISALNTGRYNLPQVFYPGSDPNETGIKNILAGLKQSFSELASLFKNPVLGMLKQDKAKTVNLSKSFMRLQSPGMKKIGGGQRVARLEFYDEWNELAGGNEISATYGKKYDYTTDNDGSSYAISSGVASYEPMIGGDENPFRNPIKQVVQSGSKFPPNDPIELFQEHPLGESLFPSPVVIYSKVRVRSIHNDQGRSSQGIEEHQFYTAKEFPVIIEHTPIAVSTHKHVGIFKQSNSFTGTQGYSLILNDMHGKPKSIKNYVHKPAGNIDELINSKEYVYYTDGAGNLNNNVPVLEYVSNGLKRVIREVGVETDMTLDSRNKSEHTYNDNGNFSLNVVMWGYVPVPLPFIMPWEGQYDNEFYSAVSTKVVQKYDIVKEIRSYSEGAITTVRNEAFDPITGQALITSVDNEFKDKEYSMSYPAYWVYSNMGGAYQNVNFEEEVDSISINTAYNGVIPSGAIKNASNYNLGDELLLNFKDSSGASRTAIAWVMGENTTRVTDTLFWNPGSEPRTIVKDYCDGLIISPRLKYATAGWNHNSKIYHVNLKVLRSGRKNMLDQTVQSYTSMENPIVSSDSSLRFDLHKVIDLKANDYHAGNFGDPSPGFSVNQILNNAAPNHAHIASRKSNDTINPYATALYGVYRPANDYVYLTNRGYSGTSVREIGLYDAASFWQYYSGILGGCFNRPVMAAGSDSKWKTAKTVTKWTAWGQEIENKDALGNYTTAVYGYNEELPVAVAQNAKQGEVLSESFEDYQLLQTKNNSVSNWMSFNYSPFRSYFANAALGSSSWFQLMNILPSTGPKIVKGDAHSGYYALQTPSSANNSANSNVYTVPLAVNQVTSIPTLKDYFPFLLSSGKKYIISFWIKPVTAIHDNAKYIIQNKSAKVNTTLSVPKLNSNIIDGWQQVTTQISVASTSDSVRLLLPLNYLIDDLRIFPTDANMKGFVYHPVNEKLMATLDENNYATFYEYDQEGNLVRTKKETEKGIMTLSESRSEKNKK